MWTSTWPGLAGFGVLPADSVHARPPYSTCRPGHLPRGSVPPGVPDEAVLLSPAPGGSPYILYGSPNERPQFGPPPEPQIRQDLYGYWLRKIGVFFKQPGKCTSTYTVVCLMSSALLVQTLLGEKSGENNRPPVTGHRVALR